MQKPRDWLEGMKHSSTAQTMRHLRVEVMELCEGAGLYQIDLLNGSKERVSEAEYWVRRRGQLKLDRENAALTVAGQQPKQKKFETVKDILRKQISSVLYRTTSFEEFSDRLMQQYGIAVKESRGQLSYLPAGRTKFIRAKHLGDNYDKKAVFATLNANVEHKPKVQFNQDTIGKLIDIQSRMTEGKGIGYGQTHKQHQIIRNTEVLRKIFSHTYDIKVVSKYKCQNHQRYRQPDKLIPPTNDGGKMTDQPAGKSLCHFIFVGKIIGNAHYNVGKHDADQRDHDNVLELDTLDEPDKDPCTQNGTNEGKGSTSPQGRTRCKQQRQQNAKLRRRDRRACGGRNKLVHAELLHDKPRHAHANACAEDGKQTRQAGDQKDLPCFHAACKQVRRPDVQHPDKQRTNRKNHQQNAEKNSGTTVTNEKPSSRLVQTNFF